MHKDDFKAKSVINKYPENGAIFTLTGCRKDEKKT